MDGGEDRRTTLAVIGLVACVLALLTPAAGLAATTGRLTGTVSDPEGKPLPAATVTIASEALIGGPQTALTDGDGEFVFHLLPVGLYAVEANLSGFEPATAEVRVRLDRVARVAFRLAPLAFEGELVVSSNVPVVDTTQVATGQVFGREYLERATVGMGGRLQTAIYDHVPGVIGATNPGVLGSLAHENAHRLDGVDSSEPSAGTRGTFFNLDVVEEVSFTTGGFGAELGLATGGVVNLVTKSGGNQFSGSVDIRYRDQDFNESGEHYDPDEDVSSRRIVSATLGGPVLRDRLWFFAAFSQDLQKQPYEWGITRRWHRDDSLAKLTWAAGRGTRLALTYAPGDSRDDNYYASQRYAAEAQACHEQEADIVLAELSSLLGESLLLRAAAGHHGNEPERLPMHGDLETPAEYDVDTPLIFSNTPVVFSATNTRDQVRGDLTWLVDRLAGSHELEGGLEASRLDQTASMFKPGGYMLVYLNNGEHGGTLHDGDGDGLVDFMLLQDYPPETARDPVHPSGDTRTVFVQDAWRPLADLTIKAGLRLDSVRWENGVGQTVADFESWQPRLGAAWDVGGRARHVLRASWGRFMHPAALLLASNTPGVPRGEARHLGLDYLCSTEGMCDRETLRAHFGEDSELIHLDADGDEHPFYLVQINGLVPRETVDTMGIGQLRPPTAETLILGYEAQVLEQSSLALSWVHKRTRSLIEDTCRSNTWAWGDGPWPSLDDPATWTDETACSGVVSVNLPGLGRDYRALIASFESRARPWLHVLASYTYSRSRGSSDAGSDATGGAYDRFPTQFVNTYGSIQEDRRHTLKLNGYLLLPHDFTLSVDGSWSSAGVLGVRTDCSQLLNPTAAGLEELARLGIDVDAATRLCQSAGSGPILVEPRGRRRGEDLWQLDLQVSKGFELGRLHLEAIAAVINLFSTEAATGFDQNPLTGRGWGAPFAYQDPRRYELGLRLEF